MTNNPLLSPSTLEFELPDFARFEPQHFVEAVDVLAERQTSALDEIVTNTDKATFDNTVLPLEALLKDLIAVVTPFFTITNCDLTPEYEAVQETVNVKLAVMENEASINSGLHARLSELDGSADLTPEQAHIVTRRLREMTLAGAALEGEKAQRVKELNERLATLGTQFDQKLLADTQDLAVHFDAEADLDGLNASEIEQARDAAATRGMDGYLVPLTYPTGHAYLARLTNRDARRRLMDASLARASRGNDNDTRELILEIVRLRAERAALLGFDNHAAWTTAGATAKTTKAVLDMVTPVAQKAGENARREQEEFAAAAAKDGITDFSAWDWDFYATKVRKEQYDVDVDALRSYFELESVVQNGVFAAAHRLYGLSFHERTDLVGWNADTRVYEVRDESDAAVGLFLLDPYARDAKKGGAWMHELVTQNKHFNQRPVICNNLNVTKPAGNEPALLTFDEVETFFHEFGHALHGLLSNVTYPSVAGTNVERDFVEFPSQVNEMWMLWPGFVDEYAKHVETGEPIPADVLARLEEAKTFNQGFMTSELMSAALIDFEWHMLPEADVPTDVDAVAQFDQQVRVKYGLNNEVVKSRYYTPYFQHIFSGGYSASYYGYLWAEVLDADTVRWFHENGGLTRENGRRFAQGILSVGGSVDAIEAFRAFRGRDADPQALLERRGLAG